MPYSHSTTQRIVLMLQDDNMAARTGLGRRVDTILDALNNLYSVPADARLPLGFEPLSLRRMEITKSLDYYLVNATRFLDKLHQASGTLIIWDYDTLGNHFCYYPSDLRWSDRNKLLDVFPVTPESIRWHRYSEHRPVDRYYKLIPQNIYLEFFKLLTDEEPWYATNWAARSEKWLRVVGHLKCKEKSTWANNPQYETTRYVLHL